MEVTLAPTRRRRIGAAAVALITAALALTACSGPSPQATSDPGSRTELVIGNPQQPLSINPALSGNGRLGTFLQPAYEPLVRTNPDGELTAALAESWSLSDDNRTATFTLRKGAAFSDGEPVNAEAAKKSIDYYAHAGGPFSNNFASLESIDVLDDYTFSVTLGKPNPQLLSLFNAYNLAGDLISPKALQNPDALGTATAGAGPYVLDPSKSVSGKTYVYVPNEHYYGKAAWEKVTINVYEDQNAGLQAMKTGQVDILMSDPLTANANANAGTLPSNISIVSSPTQWTGAFLSDRNGEVVPALGDVRVRQAINYAIDRSALTRGLFGDFADPTDQIQIQGLAGYDPAFEQLYPYDLDKARKLMADAGYASGFTLPLVYQISSINTVLAQAIQGQLSQIGIKVELREVQNPTEREEAFRARQVAGEISQMNGLPPFLASIQLFDPTSRFNPFGYTDEKMSALLAAARAASGADADQAWHAAYQRAIEQAWFAPTSAVHIPYFVADGLKVEAPGLAIVVDMALVVPSGS